MLIFLYMLTTLIFLLLLNMPIFAHMLIFVDANFPSYHEENEITLVSESYKSQKCLLFPPYGVSLPAL